MNKIEDVSFEKFIKDKLNKVNETNKIKNIVSTYCGETNRLIRLTFEY